MFKTVRILVPEQQLAFDLALRYVKDLKYSARTGCVSPKPLMLIVPGGAGSGKPTLNKMHC